MKINIDLGKCPICNSEMEVFKSNDILLYYWVRCSNANCINRYGMDFENTDISELKKKWKYYFMPEITIEI